jgi:flagellar biosynthesis protein FliR
MFTSFNDRLPRRRTYLRKQLCFMLVALAFIAVSLVIGTAGYMGFAHLSFTDAFLNASMILGGMGPVDPLSNAASKWFASFYALYSGVALLSTVAAMLAPTIHRLLHKLHLDQRDRA